MTWKIRNVQTQKYMDAPGGAICDGLGIIQYVDNGQQKQNQYWQISPAGNDLSTIANVATGKLLGIPGGAEVKYVNDVVVTQYAADGKDGNPTQAQLWQIADDDHGHIKIVNAATGRVLSVPEGAGTDGVGIIQYEDRGGLNQRWLLDPKE